MDIELQFALSVLFENNIVLKPTIILIGSKLI